MSSEPCFQALEEDVTKVWDSSVLPSMLQYLRIPCQSPGFDPDWQTNGLLRKAMDVMFEWVKAQQLIHVKRCEVYEDPQRTPFFILELNDTTIEHPVKDGYVLMYGHMDKQPPVPGWKPDTANYEPHYDSEGKLYGRGAADDGYAIYSAVTALRAMQKHNIPHGKVLLIIEGGEESGSADLPHYMDMHLPSNESASLIICLDSGGLSYDRMWITDSLRGVIEGTLEVKTMSASIHSGLGGGIIPCPFRIARDLLSRIEDSETGRIQVPELFSTTVPQRRADISHHDFFEQFPSLPQVEVPDPHCTVSTLIRQNTWEPCLTVTGIDGLPSTNEAGNVIQGGVSMKLSLRIPPTVDQHAASAHIKRILETKPPHKARVQYTPHEGGNGWKANTFPSWLTQSIDAASILHFGRSAGYMGLGASIPLINELQHKSPDAGMVVTGVLGPQSNAHGPNEFLHVPYVKKLTCCVAQILYRHCLSMRV